MPSHSGRFFFLSLFLFIFVLVGVKGSAAESAYTATLTVPDASKFPHVTAYLDIHDPTGGFVHGLSIQDINLQENSNQVAADTLQEQKVGAQLIVAITPGETFATRDGLGVTRYEYLLKGLLAGSWVSQPAGLDDFSLLTMDGPQLLHSSSPADLRSSLESYQPNAKQATPSLEVLASAMQVAAEPELRAGMGHAILFITPPQASEVSLGLQSILTTAIQQNIHIFVWLIASPDEFDLPEAQKLKNLADQTRGAFFAFSIDEIVPDLETLLDPLRYIYQLGYESHVTASGTQQLAAQVTVGSQQITTSAQTFEINLQPPVPKVLSPSGAIVRAYAHPPTSGEVVTDTEILPIEQVVKIQVTFPDGYTRLLDSASLYVDGALVDQNTAPPFDQLTWDLRPYTQNGTHTLQVEAVDSLGMTGKSAQVSIEITQPSVTQGIMIVFSKNRPLLMGAGVLIIASILVLVLILGGHIRPKPLPGQVKHPRGWSKENIRVTLRGKKQKDAIPQPLVLTPHEAKPAWWELKRWVLLLPWFRKKAEPVAARAYLLPLVGHDEPTIPAPMQILADETSIGSDPRLADLVIDDPSIEALHAHIQCNGKNLLITDAGSVAGTWVNYDPVPPEGTLLEHTDIIHLGRIGFRVNFAEPGPPRKITVIALERET